MKKAIKYACVLACVVGIIILVLFFNNNIGIAKSNIEKDARNSQKISAGWQVSKASTETMSAMLFYDKNHQSHTFSIYVKGHIPSLGYFFRAGEASKAIAEGIGEFHIYGYNESAYMSMNKQQISKIEINKGDSIQTIHIESTKPFAIILPVNSGSVTIYDVNGNIIHSLPQTF